MKAVGQPSSSPSDLPIDSVRSELDGDHHVAQAEKIISKQLFKLQWYLIPDILFDSLAPHKRSQNIILSFEFGECNWIWRISSE